MNRTEIKICGVTRIDDAKECAKLGVDIIGLNFYRKSPRYIRPEIARKLVEAVRNICVAGVFVEPSVDEVREVAAIVDLQCVQLHGNVQPETCRELAQEFRVIRALRTDNRFRPEDALLFSGCDLLIDAHHPELPGGTGQTCDWSAARATRAFTRFLILSGGLNAGNIDQAITAVAPHAIDACSGVESAPGVKDHDALVEFVSAVQAK